MTIFKPNRLVIARLGAALILLAQLVGAAHYHEGVAARRPAVASQAIADQSSCPVCQLAFHSPASFASVSAVSNSLALEETIVLTESFALASPVLRPQRSRAPPVSL